MVFGLVVCPDEPLEGGTGLGGRARQSGGNTGSVQDGGHLFLGKRRVGARAGGQFWDVKRLMEPTERKARVAGRRLARPDLGVVAQLFDQRGCGGRVPDGQSAVFSIGVVCVAGGEALAGETGWVSAIQAENVPPSRAYTLIRTSSGVSGW